MLLAGVFGVALFLTLVVADWFQFTRLTAEASRYGCEIARMEDRWLPGSLTRVAERFGKPGVLPLPNGVARFFPDAQRILLRPQYSLASRSFRSAWTIKGSIELEPEGEAMRLTCTKRVPWSSALLTLLWLTVVGIGTAAFAIVYLANGGLASLGGVVMGLGIIGLGLLVLSFGLVVVSLAYRLENQRLMQAYQELRDALTADLTQTLQ